MFTITTLIAAVVLAGAGKPPEAFAIHLPTEKIGYPGVEYWAEIDRPDGGHMWAFAVYTGNDAWSVPFRADASGLYRLKRVEKRDGDKREGVALAKESQAELSVREAREPDKFEKRVLVEAGTFKTIFAAQEPWCVNDHTIVQGPDKKWHLFGITHPKPLDFFKDPGRRLAHATADSLLQNPWQAQPPAVTADFDKYKEYLLWAPHVIRHKDTYYMFVCAGDKETHRYRLHLLTSPDLESWTRHPDNPLVVDGFDGRDPMVLRVQDQWVMYYTATSTPEGGNHVVACVTSKDLVHWSDRRVVLVHPNAGTFGGPVESPFVVQRGRHYYLFACAADWTDVYLSRDPFHWEYEHKVGRLHAHAPEVVRDADGRWYISHAGWESGPVSLAPLEWKDGLDEAPTSVPPAAK